MTANSFDWDDELPPETEEEVYRALLRALRRKQGFGLFFIQCSKAQGEKVVADLRKDLPEQNILELHLQGEVVTLYDQIDALWQQQPFDVLVVEGLQASLYAYEDTRRFGGWSSDEIYNYSWKGVPKILNHLNQQREHLRNDFPARFVFLMPSFAVDYFIQRAADFLDWRSGLFRFPRDPKEIAQDANRFAAAGGYAEYLSLPSQERIEKILELKSLQEIYPDSEIRQKLLSKLGLLYTAEQDYGNAVISWEKVLKFKPDDHHAWNNRGLALAELERYKEAIASYDKALEFKPNDDVTWNNRGVALRRLGRIEEAIVSYDKALEFKPSDAWNNRGVALAELGRYEEAIASYDKALEVKPDDHGAWFNRGLALAELGRQEKASTKFYEAITSYDKALKFSPDSNVFYNKACCYALLGNVESALENLQSSLNLDAEQCRELAKTDSDFDGIRDSDRFRELIGE